MWEETVLVSGFLAYSVLWCQTEGRRWNRMYPGCAGSAVFFSARFLNLELHVSWMLDRSAPVIFSEAVTVLYSVCFSCLVVKPNQTVMDVQRTDSLTAL